MSVYVCVWIIYKYRAAHNTLASNARQQNIRRSRIVCLSSLYKFYTAIRWPNLYFEKQYFFSSITKDLGNLTYIPSIWKKWEIKAVYDRKLSLEDSIMENYLKYIKAKSWAFWFMMYCKSFPCVVLILGVIIVGICSKS